MIELRTPHLVLRITPELGRIVFFGRTADGEAGNLLWLATPAQIATDRRSPTRYLNLGGDRLWVVPQDLWPEVYGQAWPPDPVIDGQPWRLLEQSALHAIIESEVSPAPGVVAHREITLDAETPRAVIRTTVTRTLPSTVPIHIWTNTHVLPPTRCLLDTHAAPTVSPAYRDWPGLAVGAHLHPLNEPDSVGVIPATNAAFKIGSYGHWVAAIYPHLVFAQTHAHHANGDYPDASSVQVYSCQPYCELELLSPARVLAVGESLTHEVTWTLTSPEFLRD